MTTDLPGLNLPDVEATVRTAYAANPGRTLDILTALLAQSGAVLGGALEWESDHLEYLAEAITRATSLLDLPDVSDQDESAHRYWSREGDLWGVDHDDLDEVYPPDDDDTDD